MSGELPKIGNKSLFTTYVEKKNAEEEAVKIKNRIDQIRQEREKILKKIQSEDQKAEQIYKHRLELQIKVLQNQYFQTNYIRIFMQKSIQINIFQFKIQQIQLNFLLKIASIIIYVELIFIYLIKPIQIVIELYIYSIIEYLIFILFLTYCIYSKCLLLKIDYKLIQIKISYDNTNYIIIIIQKEEKIRQKVEAPPPFSLSVSRAQRQTLKQIKSEMLFRKKTEVKEFRDWHKHDLKETKLQRSMDHESFRSKVIQGKWEEKQANINTLNKLKDRRDKIRYDVEQEKEQVIKEKIDYDQKIRELEQLEQFELSNLQYTIQRQNQTKEKVNLAQSLPPKEFEAKFVNGSGKGQQHQESS